MRSFAELLADCKHSAVHLEMRDVYAAQNERDEFGAWRRGHRIDWDNRAEWWSPFNEQIVNATARGVLVRRARIVSEPVTVYIQWEHYVTRGNVLAGEHVRWLPRRRTSDLPLPGNDCWVFDGEIVRIGHFSGYGELVGHEVTDETPTVDLCAAAFERVWERATPHEEYEIR